jgi:CheY-like chemotaxis protein
MREQATVLLVEDEPYIREVVSRLLAASGYRVRAASRGEEALALARDTPDVALLITDIRLPDMYGRRLVERLSERRSSAIPPLPVLYMSGHPAEISLDVPAAAHERFLQKPFEFDDLLDKVGQLLRSRDVAPGPN